MRVFNWTKRLLQIKTASLPKFVNTIMARLTQEGSVCAFYGGQPPQDAKGKHGARVTP